MAYVEEITIGSGVVSEFLKAGPEESGGDAGTIIIENGGKLVSGELLQGGAVTVSGTAEELTVNSGGTLRISGGVVSGGRLIGGTGNDQTFVVDRGGSAVNIEISATRLHISNGGVGIGNTVAVAGVAQLVRGEASHTLVLKGYERVYTGASTYMTIVNGGQQHVNEGGVTVSTIILAQQQNVSNGGVAKSTIVRDGFQSVEDGGTAEGTVVSGGYQFVKGGGSAKDTVVSDGYATVDDGGRLIGALVVGGSLNLRDGGVAQNVVAVSGGSVNVSSGGELTGLTVLSGASVGVSGGATVTGLYVSGLSDTTSARAGISGTVNNMEVHSGGNVALMGTANNVLINSGAWLRILNRNAKMSVEYNPFVGETMADYTTPNLISRNTQGASATVTFQTKDERTFHVYYGADDGKQGLVSRAIVMNGLEVEAGKSALVFAGGRLENAVIDNGGKAYVSDGATLSGVTLLAGGSLYASEGGATMYDLNIVGPTTGRLALGANIAGTGNTIYGLYVSNNVNGNIYGATVSGGSITGSQAADITTNWQFKVLGGRLYDYTITTYGDNVINNATWLALSASTASGGLGSSYASNVTVDKNARFQVQSSTADDVKVVEGGYMYVQAQGKINDLYVSGYYAPANKEARTVNAAGTVTGAEIHSGGVLSNGNTANNILVNLGGVLSMTAAAAKATVDFNPWTGTIDNTIGATVTYNTRDKGVYYGANDGRTGLVSRTDALADLTVESGYSALIYDGGALTDATVQAGGQLIVDDAAAAAGITGKLTFDLSGATGATAAFVNDNFGAIAAAVVVEVGDGTGDYTLIGANADGDENIAVDLGNGNVYATNAALTTVIDAFTGRGAARSLAAGSLKLSAYTEAHTIAAVGTAAALATSGTTLNGSDREARWTENTTYGDTVYAAEGMTAGNAWLEIDGANVGTALYGAAANQNFAGVVNMKFTSGSIRNLAAGAANGGSVKAVNFTMAGGTLAGAAYAGGFGNVTETIQTTITAGTLADGKDFYAGALANYAKTNTATTVGDISLTIAGGTFGGNIFGASAVKSSVAAAHTAGNVTLSITGGETTKGDQACIFAGGYATGSALNATVYTVGNIDATVSGGSWGEAKGGRGVFGGVFASGVTAEAQGVSITVSGGSMGNVYGGGWAQKTGGKSIVGDVNLTISGGNITNVFGGGSHSTSGGTTETGDITITVSGGNITGDIYARGQLDGDTTGAANVIFTGAANFSCGVFGYSYVGSETGDAALSFSGYTGEFAGALGGFNGITLDGSTAMTLSTESGSVSNGKWVFDLTDRAEVLAGTSLLTWDNADFAGDSIKVSFADDAQAQGGWNIAAVAEAFSGTTFDVEVGGSEIVSGLAYNQQIADGDYAGWGFTLDDGALKFKQLA